MLAMLLEAFGHDVVIELDARRGLTRAINERPDVCLLDIGLQGTDGNELAQRLRLDPRTSHITPVAVRGCGWIEDRQRTSAAGLTMTSSNRSTPPH